MSDYEDDEFEDLNDDRNTKTKIIDSSRSNAKPLNNQYGSISASPSPAPSKSKYV